MRAIAKLDEKLSGFPSDSIHGYLISSKQINKYSKVLYSLDPEEKASLPGISKDRAFTIHTASIIIDELVQYFNAEYIMVSAFGMREGVLTKDKVIDRNKWLEARLVVFNNILRLYNELRNCEEFHQLRKTLE